MAEEKKAEVKSEQIVESEQDLKPAAEKAPEPQPSKPAEGVTLTQDQFNELMNRLNNAERAVVNIASGSQQASQTASQTAQGRPVGISKKWSTNPKDYPDPTDKLYDLKELSRYNLRENFELKWEVEPVTYETKWGTMITEPRFNITLFRKYFEEDGEWHGKLIKIQKGQWHEDEQAAYQILTAMGIEVDEGSDELKEILDRARYERFRQWLIALFKPQRLNEAKTSEVETVIDGQVVTMVMSEKIL